MTVVRGLKKDVADEALSSACDDGHGLTNGSEKSGVA